MPNTLLWYRRREVNVISTDFIQKYQNVPVSNLTMLQLEQKCAHLCSKLSIVWYGIGAFWDLWKWPIVKAACVDDRSPHWVINGVDFCVCNRGTKLQKLISVSEWISGIHTRPCRKRSKDPTMKTKSKIYSTLAVSVATGVVYYTLMFVSCSGYSCTWWRHQVETFSVLLAFCAGNSSVIGEFPAQRPVTRSFDVFFDLCLNERLNKQSLGWCFETPSRSLWRHCNELSSRSDD